MNRKTTKSTIQIMGCDRWNCVLRVGTKYGIAMTTSGKAAT